MEKQLVEFEMEDGSSVIFETTDKPTVNVAGTERVSRDCTDSNSTIQKAEQGFNQVAARIRPAAQLVLDALRELNSPKEIQIEFGLKFSAKAGVIVASTDSEVNFKVSVKWVNPDA